MRTIKENTIWIFILILLIPTLTGCGSIIGKSEQAKNIEPQQQTYFIFDTVVTVKIFDEKASEAHFQAIELILQDIDDKMSRTRTDSEIAQINRQAGKEAVSVSEETWFVVERALHYSALSKGQFDLTIGPLVNLWQIGNEGQHLPSQAEIDALLPLVDYRQVEMHEPSRSIKLKKSGMIMDLGAIAKGYAADRIAEYLIEQDMPSAIIDLGGNIFALGSKPNGAPWTIGIQDPQDDRGNPIGKLKVRNKTIVSSGIYERFFIEDDVRYHHILDPGTGFPVRNGLMSVTIITDHSIDADGLSTSIFSLGLEQGMALVESIDNTEAVFITEDQKVYMTSGLVNDLEMTIDDYQLMQEK